VDRLLGRECGTAPPPGWATTPFVETIIRAARRLESR
jgi:hypothetical protein